MRFIIAETGEEREVRYEENGIDYADDIAINCGLFHDDSVVYENEAGDIVAPLEDVEFWEEYFENLKEVDSILDKLKDKYGSEEVMEVYFNERGDYDDIDSMLDVANATRDTFEKRYNLETAQLIGSHSSDLPCTDFSYYEESLYQQDTGEFFMVYGDFGHTHEDGATGWGEYVSSVSEEHAKEWIAKNLDD